MNFTLHWLRRDLRRHAPALLLWALLVALFTWARIWLRTHPQFFIGDRDLWLSVPAAALGIAEVCLLLRVLLDDPARGPHAFWKTRPPSGGAVFATKASICALAALVLPLAAEGVFLAAVGPSGGTPERVSLYLLPLVLALMAGAVTTGWKSTLVWLPAVIGILTAGIAMVVWLSIAGRIEHLADHRLISLAVLLATVTAAAVLYRRSTGKRGIVIALAAPLLAGLCAAASGWPRDARLHTPPRGLKNEAMNVSWLQPPSVSRNYNGHQWGLSLPLRIKGLPAGTYADATLRDIALTSNGLSISCAQLMDRERHLHGDADGHPGAFFHIILAETEANSLTGKPWTATGTLVFRVFDRTHHSLSLDRAHTLDAGDCCWVITPAVPGSARRRHYYGDPNDQGLWYESEYMSTAPLPNQQWPLIDGDSALLRHAGGAMTWRQLNFSLGRSVLTWEGVGRGSNHLAFDMDAVAKGIKDPATWKDWALEFDTLTLAGTLDVPFSLHVPREGLTP